MKTRFALFFLVAPLLGADEPSKDAVDKELQKLQGNWFVVWVQSRDRYQGNWDTIVQIKGNAVKLVPRAMMGNPVAESPLGIESTPSYSIKINSLENPKTFDLPGYRGFDPDDHNGIQPPATDAVGIYKWDGEYLKLNYEVRNPRPKNFEWVAILVHESAEERQAAEVLWTAFDKYDVGDWKTIWTNERKCKAKCEEIIKTHPKTAAAKIAQDYLKHGLISEAEIDAVKMLELARKAPDEQARSICDQILKSSLETKTTKKAQNLLDEIDSGQFAAHKQLIEAEKMAEQGIGLGNKELTQKAIMKCQKIIKTHPHIEAAKSAQALLRKLAPRLAEMQKEEEAGKLLDFAKRGPREKTKDVFLEIVNRFPGTEAAKEAGKLLDQLDNGEFPARRKLNLAKHLAEDGLKLAREDLKEKARIHLQEIIDLFPKSKAAEEARELLEKLAAKNK